MVIRKGFSVEQFKACLEEYADLNVLQVLFSVAKLLPLGPL